MPAIDPSWQNMGGFGGHAWRDASGNFYDKNGNQTYNFQGHAGYDPAKGEGSNRTPGSFGYHPGSPMAGGGTAGQAAPAAAQAPQATGDYLASARKRIEDDTNNPYASRSNPYGPGNPGYLEQLGQMSGSTNAAYNAQDQRTQQQEASMNMANSPEALGLSQASGLDRAAALSKGANDLAANNYQAAQNWNTQNTGLAYGVNQAHLGALTNLDLMGANYANGQNVANTLATGQAVNAGANLMAMSGPGILNGIKQLAPGGTQQPGASGDYQPFNDPRSQGAASGASGDYQAFNDPRSQGAVSSYRRY